MTVYNDSDASNPNIQGTSGADTLNGNGGNDTIRGNGASSGIDVLNGGSGSDTIYTGSGANQVHGGTGIDYLYGTNQTTFQDSLHGDEDGDFIYGNGGRDFLYGEAGNDRIDTGADVAGTNGIGTSVSGGADNDDIYSAGAISDLNGDAGNDTFHANQGLWNGSENYYGGADTDKIVADSDNTNIGINNISGIEIIDGGTGRINVDIQTSNTANPFLDLRGIQLLNINEIRGQGGNDFIVLEGGAGTGNAALTRDDVVLAGSGNDTIYSGLGNDQLFGDAGNDTLAGGAGYDDLTGGTGADTFTYFSTSDAILGLANVFEQIRDFSTADGDKIRLADIDADTSTSANDAFSFIGAAGFSGVAGELRAELQSNGTHIYGDVNADGVADFEIVLTNFASVSATDFVL